MDILNKIRKDEALLQDLCKKCDIVVFDDLDSEVGNEGIEEIYSIDGKCFAVDSSGGQFLILEDDSIGFIGSEGEVGRIAESLEELFTMLVNTECFSNFSSLELYTKKGFLEKYCTGFTSKCREKYKKDGLCWDEERQDLAKALNVEFSPTKLPEIMRKFYKTATREPLYTCKYDDNGEIIECDPIITSGLSLWIYEETGITKEEVLKMEDI